MAATNATTADTSKYVSEVYAAYDDDLCGGFRVNKGYLDLEWIEWRDEVSRQHRDGGLPSMVWKCGDQHWCVHGVFFREGDLPHIVRNDGKQEWKCNLTRTNLHRDGNKPAVIFANGDCEWWVKGTRTGTTNIPPPGAIFPGQFTKPARPNSE